MVVKINPLSYRCPFCGNELASKISKCFNIYCQGQKFNVGNLVINRVNPDLGIGKIIRIIEFPVSKSLDDEDTQILKNYKVLFKNNIIRVLHPIDLIHYIYEVNDKIETKQGLGVINSKDFIIKDGAISYEFLKENGKKVQLDETEIYAKYTPKIELAISQQRIDPPRQFLIKYWANLFHSYYTSYQIKCITNSRLSLMPHQINVTHRLSEDFFPRIILADEVGLGKTIEAGIYLKEMIARNLAERVLIIVPASLVKQWQFEMSNKFHISFTIYDGKRVKELQREGKYTIAEKLHNPFLYDNLIICSLQFARNQKYIELLSAISWDVVIFDEAHHLRRYLSNSTTGRYRETLNYELARNLSSSSESMLLLTATPLQLHSFELHSLIELIHPEAFETFSDFEHFRKNMPFINLLITNIKQIDKLNNFEVKNTVKLLKDLRYIDKNKNTEKVLMEIKNDPIQQKLLEKIEQDHTLSKFLIRNRKKNVFTEDLLNKRVVHTIIVNPTQEELKIYNEIRLYLAQIYNSSPSKENVGLGFVITTLQKLITSSKYAILKSLERRLEQIDRYKDIFLDLDAFKAEDPEFFELEVEEEFLDSDIFERYKDKLTEEQIEYGEDVFNQEKILREFYNKLKKIPYDSKSDKLLEVIEQIHSQNPKEKIIIFTQFVDTLFYLKSLLESQKKTILVEVFYGGLDKDQKDEAVERFKNSQECSILISTEIGGEGRNFQFCRTLINFDLPWNPMKLEQRIGRLDRIGQESREIFIYNFYMEGTVETDVVYALIKRINLFEESIGILEPIIGRIEKDLKNVIFAVDDGKRRKQLNQFYRNLDEEIKKAKEIEMQLDDLMIDKRSFQMDGLISSLASCIDVKLTHDELYLLMSYFFDHKIEDYGDLKDIKDQEVLLKNPNKFITKITIDDELRRSSRHKLSGHEFTGIFNLDYAREKEEFDFFALGHPLINTVLDFCRSESFKGKITVLKLKNNAEIQDLGLQDFFKQEFFLFVFEVKFQGYIIETQIIPVVIDAKGNKIDELKRYVLNIDNFHQVFDFDDSVDFKAFDEQEILNLKKYAKRIVKSKTSFWKDEILQLNDKIFTMEQEKKKRVYNYNQRSLRLKAESIHQQLERKKKNKPTERQIQNIRNLTDPIKKQERIRSIEKLKEEIRFLERDAQSIEKKLDELSFEFEDLKNEMKKRNLGKFYTNLLSFAIIIIPD